MVRIGSLQLLWAGTKKMNAKTMFIRLPNDLRVSAEYYLQINPKMKF